MSKRNEIRQALEQSRSVMMDLLDKVDKNRTIYPTWTIREIIAHIAGWDDTAIARYHLDFSFEPPNAHAGRIRITDVFRRIDGRWVIMHHHEGKMPTGFPPITE